jgi:serine/threonine-protein kinase
VSVVRFGSCRVLESIGSGPLTVVYRAEQEPIGRIVAIKALRGTVAPSSPLATQLDREAHILARLSHPGVVSLYDFVKTDDAMWLVLEHVDGPSLRELLAKSPRGLAPESVIAIGYAIASALAHAHEHGVIHRDMKPANILLSKKGEVKLVDFSVAHEDRLPSTPEPIDGTGAFGTPAYMSPEQVLGEAIDARTDVFSLGIVLYEMLCGSRPFDGPDARATTQRIRHDAPAPITRVAPGTPLALAQIVDRCLEKHAEERPPSAAALGEQLAAVADELGISLGSREIGAALLRAGFVDRVEATSTGQHRVVAAPAPPGVGRAAIGHLFVLAAMVAGGGAIQTTAQAESPQDRGEPLELVPDKAGSIRVVARPWATVFVDGQEVDVTPFARPIPVRAGEHDVMLRHPAAADEHRVVKLRAGESALVEVEMKVPEPPPKPAPSSSAPPAPTTP